MTISEIQSEVGEHSITHIFINEGEIPEGLFQLAPHCKELKLRGVSGIEQQIDRSVGICVCATCICIMLE